MLKKIFLISAGLFLLMPLQAQTPEKKPSAPKKREYVFGKVYRAEKDPAKYKDSAKAKELLLKRDKTVAELAALKKKLVRENDALAKLQAEFDTCLKRLGEHLAAKDSVKAGQREISELDKEAEALPKKVAELEKQLAEAQKNVKSSDAKVASEGFKAVEKLQKEIAAVKKQISGIPARKAELERKLRNTMRIAINQDRIPEVTRMKQIADEMTLIIESTEDAKRINSELKAIDTELDKLLKK